MEMSKYSYSKFVNVIAIEAMRDYMPFIKAYPNYGWKIRNAAGPGDYTPGRNDLYYMGIGYSFAKAVMIAASCKEAQPLNDIHLEPMQWAEREYDREYSKWCLQNNLATGSISQAEYDEIDAKLHRAVYDEVRCPYCEYFCHRSGDCADCMNFNKEQSTIIKYYVVGTYEDGSECDEELNDPDTATTRAGYLIENFHCSVRVVDSEGNEYPIF